MSTRKLKSPDVRDIFLLKDMGYSHGMLAYRYKLSVSGIKAILKGKSYKAQSIPEIEKRKPSLCPQT